MLFAKDYWFHHKEKGYFRVRVTQSDVLMEMKPNEFVYVYDLYPTRKGFMEARSDKVRDCIRLAHLREYEAMLKILQGHILCEEQDKYIIAEMQKEGYLHVEVPECQEATQSLAL